MRFRTLVFALLLPLVALAAQKPPPRSTAEIRKEMAGIRRSTDWGNPTSAKEANEKIAKLAEEMLRSRMQPPDPEPAPSVSAANEPPLADPNEEALDLVKINMMFVKDISEAVGRGDHGDILLGTKIRESIVEDYRKDTDPQIKNPDFLAEMRTLILDLSSPAAPPVIEQMESFRAIDTLIIMSGTGGAPVDLPMILKKAAGYPLRELYIINFKSFVTALPAEVGQFAELQLLAVFNNDIGMLPPEIANLQKLETLYIDLNPIHTVLPVVRLMSNLRRLGIGKTMISTAEQTEIRRLFPDCSLLME